MKDLIIIGASGFGREVAWLVERINNVERTWNLIGFIDDNANLHNSIINGYPVLGDTSYVKHYNDAYYVCAIGSSNTRKKIINKLNDINPDIQFGTIIDPSVVMSNEVIIEGGCIICANTVITVNVEIGKHTIINLDCTVGHDAILQDYVTLFPSVNVSGNTRIQECTEVGTGSNIIQGMNIGSGTIIGAGSVIVRDIPNDCTAVGVPAKPIKYHL